MLPRLGVDESAARRSCGTFNASFNDERVEQSLRCFQKARAESTPVELSINFCADCTRASLFVWTPESGLHAVHIVDDRFSPKLPYSVVAERCEDLAIDDRARIRCTAPKEIERCEEPAIPFDPLNPSKRKR